jgi:hypothetical protein
LLKDGFKKHCLKILFFFSSSFSILFIKNNNFVIQSTFIMSQNIQEDLVHIRSMMERSSRFISLADCQVFSQESLRYLVRVMLLFLFESNEMSYFDGLEKVYSDDLIDKLMWGL